MSIGRAALVGLLLGASATLHAERLPIKTYTTADGLAHNNVNRIVRDSRGFLWFCTADGLSRFDGYTFTNFGAEQGLPHSSVTDLLETRAGDYWVATGGGLARFDPRRAPVPSRPVPTPESPRRPAMFTVVSFQDTSARSRSVNVIREGRDGTIWAGTDNGLYRLDPKEDRPSLRPVEIGIPNDFPEQRFVADVIEDGGGSLWIAAPSGLYRRWTDGTTARYTERDGLPGVYIQNIFEDHERHLWIGTRSSGLFRITADVSHRPPVITARFDYDSRDPYTLPTPWVFQLFESSDGRFWVATARGLAEFFPAGDEYGRHFHSYDQRNGLSYFDITALAEDLGGNLWMGTNSAGAMKLTNGGFRTYGAENGIESVNAIFEDGSGNPCFRGHTIGDHRAADGGTLYSRLGCFTGLRFDWLEPAGFNELVWGWVSERVTLQARTGEWWVGTGKGLYRFPRMTALAGLRTARPLAVYTPADGLSDWQIFRLFEDSRGNVWISTVSPTRNGLARWDPTSGRVSDLTASPGLPSFENDRPRSFAEDGAGAVWIGFNNALTRYSHGQFTSFATGSGLPSGAVMDIYVDHAGRTWLASAASGLVRVDRSDTPLPSFAPYTTANGLSSNHTVVIAEDLQHRLYVGGGRGLDRLDPATGRVKHFTTDDGLAPGVLLAAFRDRGGVLWFGTSSGLARFIPTVERSTTAPPVVIAGVRIRGVPQVVSELGEQEMSLGNLAPDQNQLQVDFVGLGFAPGDVLRYQYRLQGVDPDWSAPGTQRTVTYASLAPGRYMFNVRAVNADGVMSDHPASIAFGVLQPVWLRWWFLALAALAVGAAIGALYRSQVTRVLQMANMRTRIATDLHDDIGANLTRIVLLSEVARKTHESSSRPDEDGPLGSIGTIARESVSAMSDIVWAINPARDSLRDLIRRMRRHAEDIFTLRDIALHFSAPETSTKLSVDLRRDILLIFKEAVSNVARHARCSRVDIDLRLEAAGIVLTITDDGVGFDTADDNLGHGLASMSRRAGKLHGTLDIASAAGSGTKLTLCVPA